MSTAITWDPAPTENNISVKDGDRDTILLGTVSDKDYSWGSLENRIEELDTKFSYGK